MHRKGTLDTSLPSSKPEELGEILWGRKEQPKKFRSLVGSFGFLKNRWSSTMASIVHCPLWIDEWPQEVAKRPGLLEISSK